MSDEQRRTGEQPPTPDELGHAPTPQGPLEHAELDDPWLVDRLLSGDGGDEWSSVTDLFAAATGPAEADELRGERAAVASFQAARAAAAHRRDEGVTVGRGARRVAVVSTLLAGKFAAVTVAGIVTLGAGGMAAAAYTGILPAPLQDVAHRTIGAPLPNRTSLLPTPTPTPESSPSATAADPATAPTSHGGTSVTTTSAVQQPARPVADLCADWRQQQSATTGPVLSALTQAAGSTPLDAFCASLTTPTTEPTGTPPGTPTTDPTATPSDTASPSETSTPSPTTASDEPTTPPMTASDQPTTPTQEPTTTPVDKPTGP